MICFLALALLAILSVQAAHATGEFRAYWVDAWHQPGICTPSETTATVNYLKSCNCNVIVAQVSKVADSYFTSSYFPRATNVQPGYDALADVITKAHAQGMEVHAWVCVYRCWTQQNDPPWEDHVYKLHPGWLSQTNTGVKFAGNESYLDPGNPAAMMWLVNAFMEIVNNYDIDGLQFDRIRYPGTDWGYNVTAVGRFNREYGRTGTPNSGDPVWTAWRKAQINAFVKQMYCKIMAVKPHVKLGASVWKTAATGARDYLQDWSAWTQGHYIDYVCPMNYTGSLSTWNANNAENQGSAFGRHVYPGQDTCGNGGPATASQVSAALSSGNPGVSMFSYNCSTSAHRDALVSGPFAAPVLTADMPWKSAPTKGILMGTIKTTSDVLLYGAQVSISGTGLSTTTDGTGFFGILDVTPGTYTVTISKCGYVTQTFTGVTITAGAVTTQDAWLAPDGVPPVISSVASSNIQATNAVITWNTDEVSSTQVEYGTTTEYGNLTTENTLPVTSHSMQLLNLTPNTLYHYRVISKDCAGATAVSGDYTFTTAGYDVPADIIKDDADASGVNFSGGWITSSYAGQWGSSYRYCSGTVQGKYCTWTPHVITAGSYSVYAWWVAGSNRATNSPFFIQWNGGSQTVNVNQQINGSQWFLLASNKQFSAGSNGYVRLTNSGVMSDKNVIADAIKLVSTGDYEPPTTPTNLRVTTVSTNRIDMAWDPSTDNKGVSGYYLYRGEARLGSYTGTNGYNDGLLANAQYAYTVTAYDTSGNESAPSNVLECYTLPLPPTTSNVVCDRSTDTWYNTGLFSFSSTDGFGVGRRQYYRVMWDTNPTYTFTGGEEQWGADAYTASCQDSGIYYLHLQSCNGDGVPNGTLDLGPFMYDNSGPDITVTDDGAFTHVGGQLHATWTGADPESGVTEYQYAVGTSPSNLGSVVPWTSVGTNTSVTTSGLTLTAGTTYYFGVKGLNGAGVWSEPALSDGITAASVANTIAEAKALPDGTTVILQGKQMSAAFGTFCYLTESDRSCGIRVNAASPAGPSVLDVAGVLQTINGERVLADAQVIQEAAGSWPTPVFMPNREIGGGSLNEYTPGITGAFGAHNLGLLITTTGKVTFVDSGFCYLDDGSALDDGSGHIGIKVETTRFTTAPAQNQYLKVTGISAAEVVGANTIRVIRPRGDSDKVQYVP